MTRYKTNGLPWAHGIGTNVKGVQTSREVMQKAELDFTVQKCEVVAKMPFSINGNNTINEEDGAFQRNGNIYREIDNAYATYRTDLNVPLGMVKSKYEVIQNVDAFNFFDEAIGKDKAEWQYAGYYGIGHKVFVTAKIPVTTKVGGDPINNYLVFSNSHDGSSSIDILFTPIRVFCLNCLNAAFNNNESHIRIRHTKTAKDRLDEGARILHIACEYANNAQDIYNAIYNIKMNDEQVFKYIASVILTEDEMNSLKDYDQRSVYKRLYYVDYSLLENTKISTRKANQYKAMCDYYFEGVAQDNILGTGWGAYNAITGYYSNVANLEGEKRMDSLLYGNASKVMSRALNNVMAFAA